MLRLFGGQRGRRHSGLGVGFQQDQAIGPAAFIPAEIGSADAPASQGVVGPHGIVQTQFGNFHRHIGGDHMPRAAGFVFGVVIVPAIGDDVGHAQGPLPHHRCGQLATRRVGLDHDVLRHILSQLRRAVGVLVHQINADAGPFVVGFNHIGRRHHVGGTHITGGHDHAVHDGQSCGAVDVLCPLLVHGQRRGQHARMRVRHADPFQQPLDAAIFAPTAMQAVQDGRGLNGLQNGNEVGASIDLNHLISSPSQCGRTSLPACQGHLALCRGATQ
mmetsp:Transcript_29190/g.56416  ORF Transcript_29190/g.56416 Transcript_29190/m.56416 type:complete len:273 (-) Transcript_29190:7778-8596(-)